MDGLGMDVGMRVTAAFRAVRWIGKMKINWELDLLFCSIWQMNHMSCGITNKNRIEENEWFGAGYTKSCRTTTRKTCNFELHKFYNASKPSPIFTMRIIYWVVFVQNDGMLTVLNFGNIHGYLSEVGGQVEKLLSEEIWTNHLSECLKGCKYQDKHA